MLTPGPLAAEAASRQLQEHEEAMAANRGHLEECLSRLLQGRVVFHGRTTDAAPGVAARLPNTCSFSLVSGAPELTGEAVARELRRVGVYVSTGAACHAAQNTSVLRAFGVSEDVARRAMRWSVGHATTVSEMERAVKALVTAVKQLDVTFFTDGRRLASQC